MAKVNFKQQKRQRENARKQRQVERLSRRGERPAGDGAAELVGADAPATAELPASAST